MKQLKTLLTIALCGLCMLANSQSLPCNNEFFVKHYKLGKANYDKQNYAAALHDIDIAGQICPTCQDCKTMLADCKAKIKAAQQKADRIAEAKAAQKEQERLAKEEADKIAKADREEKERLAKEETDKITKADREEKERLAQENADLKRKLAEAQKPKIVAPPVRTTIKFMDLPYADMVYVEGGTFMMGDVFGEGEANEKPVHSVTVSGFYMGKYEVTQAQWVEIMGDNPSNFKNCDDCPVEQVSWNDVQTFLTKLNAREGRTATNRYRLPTEAEWEYAAREKGKKVRFGNGKDLLNPSEANFDASAAYKKSYSLAGEYRSKTVLVNSFQPNNLGLYNMTGNVWEWCADWYKGYPGSTVVSDYTNSLRVLRGGSWNFNPQLSRVALRDRSGPSYRNYLIGFRLVFPQ